MRRIAAVLLAVCMLLMNGMMMSAGAQEGTNGFVTAVLTTDKQAYEYGEEIHATLTVENQSAESNAEIVSVNWSAPQMCVATGTYSMANPIRIGTGSNETIEMTFVVANNPAGINGEEQNPEELLPQTGDSSNVLLWTALLALAVFALLKMDSASRRRLTALLLCAALSMSMLPLGAVSTARAEGAQDDEGILTFTVEKEIVVMGSKVKVAAQISYQKAQQAYIEIIDMNSEIPELSGYGISSSVVELFWLPTNEAEGYEIHRSTSANSGYTLIADVTGTTAQLPATKSKVNYFKIRAYRAGEQPEQRIYSLYDEPFAIYPMPPASGLSASLDASGNVVLKWKAAAGAQKYNIYYSDMPDSNYELWGTGAVSGTKATLKDLPADLVDAYFKVEATRTDKGIVSVADMSAVLQYHLVQQPTDVKGYALESGKIKLTWNAAHGVDSYEIHAATSKTGKYTPQTDNVVIDYQTSPISANVAIADKPVWYFKLRSVSSPNGSPVYGNFTQPFAVYRLDTPTKLKATVNSLDDVTLTWNKVTNANKYRVEYKDTDGEFKTWDESLVTTNKAVLKDIPRHLNQIELRVTALRDDNNGVIFESAPSDSVSFFLLRQAEVTGNINKTTNKIELSWAKVEGATGYEIHASTSKTSKYKLQTDSVTMTSETSAEIELEKKPIWYFKVRSYTENNGSTVYGNYSQPFAVYRLDTPTKLKATITSADAISLTWNKVTNAKEYRIEYKDAAGNYQLCEEKPTTNKATVTSIPHDLNYVELRVTAVRVEGGVTFESTPSESVGLFLLRQPLEMSGNINKTTNKIELSWGAVTGADGYEVQASTSKTSKYKPYVTTTGTSAELELDEKPIWYFKVRSYNVNAETGLPETYSNFSQPFAVYRLATPAKLKATVSTKDEVTLTWNKVTNAKSYKIEYRDAAIPDSEYQECPETLVKPVTTNKVVLKELPADINQLELSVTAIREEGGEIFSSHPATVNLFIVRQTPEIRGNILGPNQIELSWAKVAGAQGYEISAATSKTGKYTPQKDVTLSDDLTSATVTIADKPVWYFKVRSYTINAETGLPESYSNYSQPYAVYRLATPTKLKASMTAADDVTLTWAKVTNAQKYEVSYCVEENGEYTPSSTVTTTKATLSGLPKDVNQLYFRVTAVREDETVGETFRSEPAQIGLFFVSQPPEVTGNIDGLGAVKLNWSEVTGATGYEIHASTSEKGKYTLQKNIEMTELTSAKVTIADKAVWYFKVRAYIENSDGGKTYGNYSQPFALYRLAKPTKLKAVLTNTNDVKLTWTKVPNAHRYKVEWSNDVDGTYTSYSFVTNEATLTGLSGQMYFRVTAIRDDAENGVTFVSEPAQVGIYTVAAPANLSGTSVAANKVALSWEEVPEVTGYEVHASTSKTGSYSKKADVTAGSADVAATKGKVNYFKVRAYYNLDGVKTYSDYSNLYAIYPLDKPTGLNASLTADGLVKLTWSKVSNAKQYNIFYSGTETGEYTDLMTVTTTSAVLEQLPDTLGDVYLRVEAERTDGDVVSCSALSDAVTIEYGINKNDFVYDSTGGVITINGYNGTKAQLKLPDAIDGYPVKAIGANAFAGNTTLTSIKLPSGLTSIGAGAFSGCTGLTTISVPSGVTVIEENTFNGCTNLESVELPNAVTMIGKRAFYQCTSLSSMVSR